ncbi:MAG: hypothetical protein V8S24_06470 [Gordonibacter pamelaeae]
MAYTADDKPASIDEFAETITAAVRTACAKHGMPEPRLLVEPGRSLVATAGVTLYTVGIIKTLPNIRKYVAVDGGMSDNIRTALYHADYEPVVANKAAQPRTEIVTIAGKHCESGDAVVIDMPMQRPDLGDVVAVFGTGRVQPHHVEQLQWPAAPGRRVREGRRGSRDHAARNVRGPLQSRHLGAAT